MKSSVIEVVLHVEALATIAMDFTLFIHENHSFMFFVGQARLHNQFSTSVSPNYNLPLCNYLDVLAIANVYLIITNLKLVAS